MSNRTKSLIDENVKPSTTILILAWPVLVEQILSTLVQSVDTAMVGSLGAVATASVSISFTPVMLLTSMIMSFGAGFTALIARSVGAHNYERANSLTRQAITTIMMTGIPLSVICWFLADDIPRWMGAEADVIALATGYNKIMAASMAFRVITIMISAIHRGFGDTKTPMLVNTGVNIANVIGNYLLIYPTHNVTIFGKTFTVWGAGWGVNGAAASTTGTIVIGAVVMICLMFFKPSKLQIFIKDSFKLVKEDMKSVTTIGVPLMLQRFVMGVASVVIASTVASLGTIAVASNSLASTIESFCYMPGFAFASAATTLIGQSLGAERPDLGEKYVATCIKIASVAMGVGSVVLFVFAPQIISLFTPDAQVIKTGSELVKLLATIQIPCAISDIYAGALRGAGDAKVPFYITLVSMWGVRVLGATVFIHVFGLSVHWVIIAMNTDNIVRTILFDRRFKTGRWKHLKF
ncbi:MAG: MATE family efflux transporter [Oscillospiraceae bacterium]|nr:MATE family efflux transporter [Oscillospiraceae bacterium]